MIRKLTAVVFVLALVAAGIYLLPTHPAKAQVGGVATVVGAVSPINQFQAASGTGAAGAVTNPASNFIIQVQGGPVYFGGNMQSIAQSQLTLPANSTNLVVWNGYKEQLYSKQAVTGPGSQGTNAINGPGIPTSLLFADPNQGEIPLATVVCNGTACGNGGNGTITDNRPLASFPSGGVRLDAVTFANLPSVPDGATIICSSCTQPTTGSATCTSGAAVVLAARVGGAWRCF